MGASIIIAAAGSAQRMCGIDKLLCKINCKEALLYSVEAFANAECTDKIVIVTAEEKLGTVRKLISGISVPIEVCVGADERQKSVLNGLALCDENSDCIMIHDAARPMITPELIDELYKRIIIEDNMAAALGVKVKDTIKCVDNDEIIASTPDRTTLRIAQTPQGFEANLYRLAINEAVKNGKDYTDDCQLVEAIGNRVYIVDSDYKNIKITTPEDLILAEIYLKERENV